MQTNNQQDTTTLTRTLKTQKMVIVKLYRTQGELTVSIANLAELAYAQCACVLSAGKMADLMYGHPRVVSSPDPILRARLRMCSKRGGGKEKV